MAWLNPYSVLSLTVVAAVVTRPVVPLLSVEESTVVTPRW